MTGKDRRRPRLLISVPTDSRTVGRVDAARLDLVVLPAGSRDLVLLAHGGQEHSVAESPSWRTPLLRMWPFARSAAQAGPHAAVGLLRYRYRGWNGDNADAAADLRAVLDRIDYDRVLLIGHSMGGRAVMRLADHDRVRGVLALAPWLPEADPRVEPRDRVVVLAHGADDRITDPRLTCRYAADLRAAGGSIVNLSAAGETHPLLRRYGDWNELVRRFVGHTLGFAADGITDLLDSDPSRPPDPLPRWSRGRGSAQAVAAIAAARLRLPVIDRL
jgi:pimeloyl-ACP methyl ester carboxylesterase